MLLVPNLDVAGLYRPIHNRWGLRRAPDCHAPELGLRFLGLVSLS
jgi:hypothetical protein